MSTVEMHTAHPRANRTSARGRLAHELGLVAWQVRYDQRSFWRNRRRAIFTFAFPLMFLLVFGSLDRHAHISQLGGISYDTFYVPSIVAYAIMTIGFSNMAMSISYLRFTGIVKRMRSTPMPWASYLGAITISTILTIAFSTVLLCAIGAVFYGVHVRLATLPGLFATLVLGTACFTTLGIAAARAIPRPDSGMPVLMFITLPLSFISNVFYPLEGGALASISKLFPLRPLADGLETAFYPRSHGPGLVGGDLLTLAIWTGVGFFLMVKTMRVLSSRD